MCSLTVSLPVFIDMSAFIAVVTRTAVRFTLTFSLVGQCMEHLDHLTFQKRTTGMWDSYAAVLIELSSAVKGLSRTERLFPQCNGT